MREAIGVSFIYCPQCLRIHTSANKTCILFHVFHVKKKKCSSKFTGFYKQITISIFCFLHFNHILSTQLRSRKANKIEKLFPLFQRTYLIKSKVLFSLLQCGSGRCDSVKRQNNTFKTSGANIFLISS